MKLSSYIKENTQTVMLSVLAIAFLWVANYTFDRKVAMLGDNTDYYLLGKSLANGSGYTNTYSIHETPANHFPPGYPVIIAATIKVLGDDVLAVKTVNSIFLMASVLLLFFIIKRVTGNLHVAFVAALLCVFNVHLLEFSSLMMSEISFLFFSLLAVYFLLKTNDQFRLKDRNFWFFIIALAFSFHIRTLGIGLLAGAFLHFFFAKRWKHLILTISGFVLLALPWYLRGKSLGGSDYMENLLLRNKLRPELGRMSAGDWLPRIGKNVEGYLTREIPNTIFPAEVDYTVVPSIGSWILGMVMLFIVILGTVKMKPWRSFVLGYLLGTFAILLIWPEVWIGIRFLVPLIPFFIVSIVQVFASLGKWITRSKQVNASVLTLVIYLPLVLLLFSFSGIGKLHESAVNEYESGLKNYVDMAEWAADNLPEDAIVACRKETVFHLYSNKKVTGYPFTSDPELFLQSLEERGVTHVVFDELGYSSYDLYLLPAANYYSGKFIKVWGIGDAASQVYALRTDLGYFGERKNGVREGKGRYLKLDGTVYEGDWSNHMRNGQGVIYDASGTIVQQGTWKDDKFILEAFSE